MDRIYPMFPPHKMRIELFFGAGGSFFDLPKPKYGILNDFDDDVTNLFLVIMENRKHLVNLLRQVPISSSMLNHWKEVHEADRFYKAVRFLFLSNFTYLGKGNTLKLELGHPKEQIISQIESVFHQLSNMRICTYDFREVLPKVTFSKNVCRRDEAFMFLDPVYLDTENVYRVPKWIEKDTLDCLDLMVNEGIKSMMCEFNHPFVMKEAQTRNLIITPLKHRHSIKAKRQEIIITNYPIPVQLFN